jgi:signal transduction histidine kinase
MRIVGNVGRKREPWIRLIAIIVATALVVVSTSLNATLYAGPLIPVFVLALVHAATLILALFRPRIAAAISLLVCFAMPLVANPGGEAPWPWAVTTLITQALVVGVVTHRAGWVIGLGTLIASAAVSGIAAAVSPVPHEQESVAVSLVVFASVAGGLLGVGLAWRQWQVIRSQLARERQVSEEERARRVIAEEKTRIARELHDVIAHSMSIINVQASSAGARHPGVDEPVRDEFEDIAGASRRALAEMRSLLSVLRDENTPRELAPQPTLSGIPELVERSAVSGTPVTLTWTGSKSDKGVADSSGLAAYRIVQEALSNVIRHAGGSSVEVRCDRGSDSISIVVENTRPPAAIAGALPDAAAGGQGLLGMRERAASVGGTLEYGPTPSGGYRIRAQLPLAPAIEGEAT